MTPDQKKFLAGLACSKKMLKAAQSSYESNPEYGLTDNDMKQAILAALKEASQ